MLVLYKGNKPEKATSGSAGYDLLADLDEPVTILPNKQEVIGTGVAMCMVSSAFAMLFVRSSLGRKGICLSNGVGIIDSDYRGEIFACLRNLGDEPYTIQPKDRICQLVFARKSFADLMEQEHLPESPRTGGFGSTGK